MCLLVGLDSISRQREKSFIGAFNQKDKNKGFSQITVEVCKVFSGQGIAITIVSFFVVTSSKYHAPTIPVIPKLRIIYPL